MILIPELNFISKIVMPWLFAFISLPDRKIEKDRESE